MNADDPLQAFEQARPALLGLAYRILGSRSDAEDAVQETFLKWQAADRGEVATPGAWLATVCTRHCLDLLRAADRARVDYVGTWLPEPVLTSVDSRTPGAPEQAASLASSLTTAFLLALQRLTPKERAAYLLREIFDLPYPEVACALDLQEAACRQLVSRARGHIEQARVRHTTPPRRQRQLLAAFREAVVSGRVDALAGLLAADVRLSSDGGGKAVAARRTMRGPDEVLRFIEAGLHAWWPAEGLEEATVNGHPGLIVRDRHGAVTAVASLGFDEAGRLSDVFIMRNPDKLSGIAAPAIA